MGHPARVEKRARIAYLIFTTLFCVMMVFHRLRQLRSLTKGVSA
jgi:hypothetical protein